MCLDLHYKDRHVFFFLSWPALQAWTCYLSLSWPALQAWTCYLFLSSPALHARTGYLFLSWPALQAWTCYLFLSWPALHARTGYLFVSWPVLQAWTCYLFLSWPVLQLKNKWNVKRKLSLFEVMLTNWCWAHLTKRYTEWSTWYHSCGNIWDAGKMRLFFIHFKNIWRTILSFLQWA